MKIILICGKSGSGKTELANTIKEELTKRNITSAVTCFSKYLKLFAKEILNWQEGTPKPRKFLQDIGLLVREQKKDYLINRMKEDLSVYEEFIDVLIISDVRMIDEIEAFRAIGAKIVKIHTSSENKLTNSERSHLTENALNDYNNYDYIIENNNADLLNEANKLIEEII